MWHRVTTCVGKASGLFAATAGLVVAWSLGPIPVSIGLPAWRLVGVLVAACLGLIGGHILRRQALVVGAIGLGLVAGVILGELAVPTDVPHSTASLVGALISANREIGTMFVASALGSAMAALFSGHKSTSTVG